MDTTIPPNINIPKNSYQHALAWWDLGECGYLALFSWSDSFGPPTDIDFKIIDLVTSPYSLLQKPNAEMHKKDDILQKTLNVEEAHIYMSGWISFEGAITLDLEPTYKDFKGKTHTLQTSWHEIEEFTEVLKKLVKRITYEASLVNSQISEELDIDFEIEYPY
jgi:hypothetical protein